jgi:hypothetical protein
MFKITRSIAAFLLAACGLLAQNTQGSESDRGFTFYERFDGSANALGLVTRLDTTAGYNFDSHFAVAGGIPIYFVRPSDSSTAAGAQSANGIGNVYGQFRLTLPSEWVNYASTLTVSAPTGDQKTGFSTGHATVDWSNYFEHTIDRVTPFGELGLANSVSDTLFFVRPYTTQGFVVHLQGGLRYRLLQVLSAGGAGYAILPSGQQTVVSRLVPTSGQSAGASPGKGKGNQPVFENSNSTTGGPDIARDYGVSTWLKLSPVSTVDFYVGYTRSARFDLNTVFFGMGVNLGKVFRNSGI